MFVLNMILLENTDMNKIIVLSRNTLNFIHSFQNEGLSPSCTVLSFDGFGSISQFSVSGSIGVHTIITLRISNFFFGLIISDETCVVEKCIWNINIGII
jgi:hypothetical protein